MRRDGVSLVELTLAFLIMGLILAPIFTSLLQTSGIIKVGQHDVEILNIGASFATQVRHLPFDDLPATGGETPLLPPTTGGLIQLGGSARIDMPRWDPKFFTLKFEITDVPLSPTLDGFPRQGKLIQLRIYTQEKIGGDKVITFPIFLTRG